MQSYLLINHVFTSNHLSEYIYVNPLYHLELRLNFLSSLPHNENESLQYREGQVKADVDFLRVRSDRIRPAIFSSLYL